MKALVIFAALMIGAQAQAKTYCTVNAQNATDSGTYDRTLFMGEVSGTKFLAIKDGASQATELNFEGIRTFEQWKAINGDTFVSLSRQKEDGSYGIVVGKVDISKSQNMLPIDAMAIGHISKNQPLNLIAVKRKVSAVCYEL